MTRLQMKKKSYYFFRLLLHGAIFHAHATQFVELHEHENETV